MGIPKEYELSELAKKFGFKNIIISPDFWVALIIAIIIGYLYLPLGNFKSITESITLTLIGANAGLLGIVLAGFAIMISLMSGKFLDVIKEAGLYEDTVFLFTYDSLLIGIGLISSIFFSLIRPLDIVYQNIEISLCVSKIFFIFSIFFSLYGLFSVVFLLYHMRSLAMLRGEMSKKY
jgi:hypothetical protein